MNLNMLQSLQTRAGTCSNQLLSCPYMKETQHSRLGQLQILALDDIRNEIIGDEEVRGISGGQRKRVNVGLELVADPVMLFLDEPTSGLDSTSSNMVISALQEVSNLLAKTPTYGASSSG